MTGLIFSGDLDGDVVFDYGIVMPACRGADLADMKRLDLKIDLRMAHLLGDRLFPGWRIVASFALLALRAVGAVLSHTTERTMMAARQDGSSDYFRRRARGERRL
jgi:hypothetical protein